MSGFYSNDYQPNLPIHIASNPPSSWYIDNAYFQIEKKAIYNSTWQLACLTQELQNPGDCFSSKFLDHPYFLVMNQKNEVKAFYNLCTHHGTLLTKEGLNHHSSCIQCPYHGWQFNFNGKVKSVAKAGGIDSHRLENLHLREIPLKKWGPFYFVLFSKDEVNFDQANERWLDRPINLISEQYNFICKKEFKVKSNWKVYIDNYLDGGYHVPTLHPILDNELNFSVYDSIIEKSYSLQVCSPAMNTTRSQGQARYYWFYPNFMVNIYGNWIDTNFVIPTNEQETTVIFHYFYQGPLSDEIKNRDITLSQQIQNEDDWICSQVQQGLNSQAFKSGPYALPYERPMYHFHQLLYNDYSLGRNILSNNENLNLPFK